MLTLLEDINAQCDKVADFMISMQELLDEYYNFAYAIQDNHVQLTVEKKLQNKLNEYNSQYEELLKEDVDICQYNGFATQTKMLQQLFVQTTKDVYDKVIADREEIVYEYTRGLRKIKSMLSDIDVAFRSVDMPNTSTQSSVVYIRVSEKLLYAYKKLQELEGEHMMIASSLDSKLEYDIFMREINETFGNKVRSINEKCYYSQIDNAIVSLKSQTENMKGLTTNFDKELQNILMTDPTIKTLYSKCIETKRVSENNIVSGSVLYKNIVNSLQSNVEEKCSPLITKTKIEIFTNSRSFESMYANTISQVYSEQNNIVGNIRHSRELKIRQELLENLHVEYIKEFSPLYSLFSSGWAKKITAGLIGE